MKLKKITALLLALVMGINVSALAADLGEAAAQGVIYETNAPLINERNTFIADMGRIYSVESAEVTQKSSGKNNLDSYDVYLSSDGKNYMLIGSGETVNKNVQGINSVEYRIPARSYARYVKFVMKAESGKGFDVESITVFGSEGRAQERIDRDATYTYYTENPYRTGDDIRLLDPEMAKLTDGDRNTMISTSEDWVNVVVDLKDAYQIGDVDIYSLAEDGTFMEGCEIRYSLDGKKFFTYTYYLNDNLRNAGIVKSSFSGMPGRYARFLKIIMQGKAENIAISEIEINGYPITKENTGSMEEVPLRVEMKNYLLAYLDWSSHNSENVSKYALYVEKKPFSDTGGLSSVTEYKKGEDAFTYKYATKTNLEPQTTYYFAVTPFDESGKELTAVTPVKITTQGVLGEKVRDIFNIQNHPGYNGGSTVQFGTYTETMKKEAVRLIDEMGAFNKNRWWMLDKEDTGMYTDIGISTFLINPDVYTSKNFGNYMYSQGNENDYTGTRAEDFYKKMKAAYSKSKNYDSRNLLCQPCLGGTKAESMKWFDEVYKAGNGVEAKNAFDVVDVHLYCQKADEQIPGLPNSAPELVSKKLENVREVMARYDDEDKPIISTECGFQTSNVDNYALRVDYETHRDYIVRLYTLMISEGVREAWYYNFHDDGPGEATSEHNFGLIDYFGVPKPAYYGFYNMYQQLKNTEYVCAVSGLANPYYGHEFYDETKNKKISIVWAADGNDKVMQFETLSGKDEKIEVIGTDGSFQVINTAGGDASVRIGKSPIYIYSEKGIKANSVSVEFGLANPAVDTAKGQDVTFTLARKAVGAGKSGYVEIEGLPAGWTIVSQTAFDAMQSEVDVTVRVPEAALEQNNEFVLRVVMDDGSAAKIKASVNVTPSCEITIEPQAAEFGNWDKWNVVVKCKNVISRPISGKISIQQLEGIDASNMGAQTIENLMPGETAEVVFEVGKPDINYGTKGIFMLEMDGQKKTFERNLNFSACVNDGAAPQIDGVISPGEWDATQVITQDAYRMTSWLGDADLSFKAYRKWDEKNFYIAIDVADDVAYQPYSGTDLWQADGVQFAIDPKRSNGEGTKDNDYFELGVARSDSGEFLTHAWRADLLIKQERAISTYTGASSRTEDGHTIYEIAIPWEYFTSSSKMVEAGDTVGFSMVVNDNDGTGRKGFLLYMRGIASGKVPDDFEDMIMVKK